MLHILIFYKMLNKIKCLCIICFKYILIQILKKRVIIFLKYFLFNIYIKFIFYTDLYRFII